MRNACIPILAVLSLTIPLPAPLAAGDVGFIEEFAFAGAPGGDRAKVLEQLVPGTEDYYFYHALDHQHRNQLDQVEQLLAPWIEKHGRTARVVEIENRQALLRYPSDPRRALDYLRDRLALRFDHQREVLGETPSLPTMLSPELIAREPLARRALALHGNTTDGFEDRALEWLSTRELGKEVRRHLLSRLRWPGMPELARMVVDDLAATDSKGFGSLPVHGLLTKDELDECLRLAPDLLGDTQFQNAYLTRLVPPAGVDWQNDAKQREAYLDRLWTFVARLGPAHNSRKVNVLYHRLVHDRSLGTWNRERFLAYVRLPRSAPYASERYLAENRRSAADLSADYEALTHLPPVRSDDGLVHSYLEHFFLTEDTTKPWEPYLSSDYLRQVFAETRLMHGLGDPEALYALLPPADLQALKERVDVDFDWTCKTAFGAAEPVALDLWLKNVKTLSVKVFAINQFNYYRENLHEVDASVDLDGLVPGDEQSFDYHEPPMRRVRRHFELAALAQPGTYVVEFVGGGKASRALVRKGSMHSLVRTSVAGQVFTVFDDQQQRLTDAQLWLGGRMYEPDAEGRITVPFSTKPDAQRVVLMHGDLCALDSFSHEAESYVLQAGIHVEREALLTRRKAQVMVRASLTLNGDPVTLAVLEEPTLLVSATDRDGVHTVDEVKGFLLHADRESVHEFQVPPNLVHLAFTLKAKVASLSLGKQLELADTREFELNGIDATDKIEGVFLTHAGNEYFLDVLGKNGEARRDRPVRCTIKHRDFKDLVETTLQTDASGRVRLGRLDEIEWLQAASPTGVTGRLLLEPDANTTQALVHGRAMETLRVAHAGGASSGKPDRSVASLLEVRDGHFVSDRSDALTLEPGYLKLDGLAAGDYVLRVGPGDRRIRIRIAQGAAVDGCVLGRDRTLEQSPAQPLQITAVDVASDTIAIKLGGATPATRVHVLATRYVPEYGVFANLDVVPRGDPLLLETPAVASEYAVGRDLGEEYRYILERQLAKSYPGNPLARPTLLLSPWPVQSTQTGVQAAKDGMIGVGGGGGRGGGLGGRRNVVSRGRAAASLPTAEPGMDLDFLRDAAFVATNLRPGDDGIVQIARQNLGTHQDLHVVAVSADDIACREVALPESPLATTDLRLMAGLDPNGHFTEASRISVVTSELVLPDITTSEIETYDTLRRVYELFVALSANPTLIEFGFALGWPKLSADEKRARYSQYASHELDFFLYRKDPGFFDAVVKPFLANKLEQTFLDEWLLDHDLRRYLEPWAWEQLNTFERILLAQRIPGETARTARALHDQLDLIPLDRERLDQLFKTALRGRALDTSDALGVERLRAAKALGYTGAEKAAKNKAAPALEAKLADEAAAIVQGKQEKERAEANKDQPDKDEPQDLTIEHAEDADHRSRAELRERYRQLYRPLDTTQEWAENNYHHLPIASQNAALITPSAFWADYADRDASQPFYSTHLAEAARSFAEMMLALAVLDLPFEAGKHTTTRDGSKLTLKAASPLIAFHREILAAPAPAEKSPVLVTQNYYRDGDRFIQEGGEQRDKFITGEMLAQVVYGCHVVITNPTSASQKLDVLVQIPRGALPVAGAQRTRDLKVTVAPYHTWVTDYTFYFPAAGSFAHLGVQVAKNEVLLAFAEPTLLHVVDALKEVDRTSWDHISQQGSDDQVLAFLREQSLGHVNLARIAWRMRERSFFTRAIEILEQRHVFEPTLWSYGILHDAPSVAREFLKHQDAFVAQCGAALDSFLLPIDPVERKTYQQLDYWPLVNARAHQLGPTRTIQNDRFHAQYQRFLDVLAHQRELSDEDRLSAVEYLLLQDRIEAAIEMFGSVRPEQVKTRLQLDYAALHLALYQSDLGRARAIASRYAAYPVDRWRQLFRAALAQLDELEGKSVASGDHRRDDRDRSQAQLAATEPSFAMHVEGDQVTITYQNLRECRVNYYLMNVELLFSRNPFVNELSGQFGYVRPNLTQALALDPSRTTFAFAIPPQLHAANVLVEITAAGRKHASTHFSGALTAQVIESYARARVTHAATAKPLPGVYVKVYARMDDGSVRFYKDGYSDHGGNFDYGSLSTNDLEHVQQFAILFLSPEHGAVVKEAAPPPR